MPELPEVETVRRSLTDLVLHKEIKAVEIFKPAILALGDEAAYAGLVGYELAEIGRRGKYLLFKLNEPADLLWVVHDAGRSAGQWFEFTGFGAAGR